MATGSMVELGLYVVELRLKGVVVLLGHTLRAGARCCNEHQQDDQQ